MAQRRYNVRVVFHSSLEELQYIAGAKEEGLKCTPCGGRVWDIYGVTWEELEILFDECDRCWTF